LPDWLKNAVTLERLEMNMRALKGQEMTGTDAEACAYLYTTGLIAPMDHDWSQIYLHVSGKTYHHHQANQVPSDIRVETLSDYQIGELNRLKSWLYHQRVGARQKRERADKRQKRDEVDTQRKAEQPVLFEF
jgi:hypothetical protein